MASQNHMFMSMMLIMLLTTMMMSMKQKFKMNHSSSSNVECGMNSQFSKNFKFSNQFFMIAIIFVIFDMELIIIMPIPQMFVSMKNIICIMMMIALLIFSILMEWQNGLLEWSKS